MENASDTPLPGIRVPTDPAEKIVAAFKEKYRIHTEGKHPRIPTWVTFPLNLPESKSDENIFGSDAFLGYDSLYFYDEHGTPVKLYQATPNQIRQFFIDREPWLDSDYYIFEQSLQWCIAVTHNDDIYVVGYFKADKD